MRNLIKLVLLVFLTCSFSVQIAFGLPSGSVTLDHVDGQLNGDTVGLGTISFYLKVAVNGGSTSISGYTTGFRIYSPDGATWGVPAGDTLNNINAPFEGAHVINYFSADGLLADTIGFGGISFSSPHLEPLFNAISFKLTVHTSADDIGKTICLDSSFFRPGNSWLWASPGGGGSAKPTWSGPHCFLVVDSSLFTDFDGDGIPDSVDNCPATANVNQADTDGDGDGNVCDNCVSIANSTQQNADGDALGDACDACPNDTFNDQDGDGICGDIDNCVQVSNTNQLDADDDGKGDACDPGEVLFSGTPLYGAPPLSVTFTDQSIATSSPLTGWTWDFGDGGSSVTQNPIHVYTTAGFFDVRLVISNGVSIDTLVKSVYVVTDTSGAPFSITSQFSAEMVFLKSADIDLDNYTDIVYSSSNLAPAELEGLWIAFGNAAGNFNTPIRISLERLTAIAIDFVNQDSLPDIIAAGSVDGLDVHLLLNNNNRTFTTSSFGNFSDVIPAVATGYFDDDQFLDIIVTNGKIYYGDGNGGFPTSLSLSPTFKAVDVADFDNDGQDDYVANIGDSAKIFLNNGLGGFSQSGAIFTGTSTSSISTSNGLADFNRDGNVDFAAVTYLGNLPPNKSIITIGFGNGSGGFITFDTLRIDGYGLTAVVTDVDRDNFLDVATTSAGLPDRLVVFLGNGTTDFIDSSITTFASNAGNILALTSLDMDRDGNPDFVTGSYIDESSIFLLYNLLPAAPVLPDEMVVTTFCDTTGSNYEISVSNPLAFEISPDVRTVAGSFYWRLDGDLNGALDDRTVDYNLQYGEYLLVFNRNSALGGGKLSATIGINGTQAFRIFHDYDASTKDAHASDTVSFYFKVEPVSSVLPVNGRQTQSAQPAFQWKGLIDSVGVMRYHFQLDEYHDLRGPRFQDSNLTTRQFLAPLELGVDSIYYWRVRSLNGFGWSDWSRTFAAYIGPGCCVGIRGNVNNTGGITVADLTYLVQYLFNSGLAPVCTNEANVNGAGGITVADLTYLVQFLFNSGAQPPACP